MCRGRRSSRCCAQWRMRNWRARSPLRKRHCGWFERDFGEVQKWFPATWWAAVGLVFQGYAGEVAARALLLLFCHQALSGRAALFARPRSECFGSAAILNGSDGRRLPIRRSCSRRGGGGVDVRGDGGAAGAARGPLGAWRTGGTEDSYLRRRALQFYESALRAAELYLGKHAFCQVGA